MGSKPRLSVVKQQATREELLTAAKEALQAAMARVIELENDGHVGFEVYEATTLRVANDASRGCLERRLGGIGDRYGDEIAIGGKRYRRHQLGRVGYHSLCGEVSIERWTYRQIGVRNGPTVVAVDLAAGLLQGATPAMAFAVAQGFARMPSRHLEEEMRALHRCPPSRSTLERLGHGLGGAARQDVVEIEAVLRKAERLPQGAHAIAVGLDRTSVPMIEERPLTHGPSSPRKPRRTPYVRQPPHPFDVMYRMAYIGTVSIVDRHGDAIVTRRYAASAEEGAEDLVARMMADVRNARAQRSNLPVVIVQDGAPELWGLMWEALRANGVHRWHEAIDRYHLNEKLAHALDEAEKDEATRRQRYGTWMHMLDHDAYAIEKIDAWLSTRRAALRGKAAIAFDQLTSYISGNQARMRYAKLRRAGFPTGSGVTEGACKSLIAMRAKRSGQRWYHDGLTAVLTLRALQQSDRLNPFWKRFSRRYSADVRAVA
jgi:hypothetical protein